MLALTLALGTVALGAPAFAEDSAPASCDVETTAAAYDQKAKQDEEAANRFHTWASAEEMFGSGNAFGRRPTAQFYEEQARSLELAAKQNRAAAAELRQREKSASSASCGTAQAAVKG
jgi:hypothetical protein